MNKLDNEHLKNVSLVCVKTLKNKLLSQNSVRQEKN